jgi:hypothetical protein
MALKTLTTLIKLHKRRVEVLRREMIALEEERRQLHVLTGKLQQEQKQEAALATADSKLSGFFGAYSVRIKARLASIAQEIKRLDTAIEAKVNAIRDEFGEQKKFEIAQENAKKRLAAEVLHRQQQRFDEIGVQQYLKSRDHTYDS